MKNSILSGAIVLTLALVPSIASAGSFEYDVAAQDTEKYTVLGSNPRLSETSGDAKIDDMKEVAPGVHDVWVKCLETTGRCLGVILTD